MDIELTERELQIYQLIYTKDFHMDLFLEELNRVQPTPEETDRVAYKYVEECFCDADQIPEDVPRRYGELYPGLESSHMLEVITELLKYGLNPNTVFCQKSGEFEEKFNIMDELQFVDNGYVAADTLAVLLEHGGNPGIILNGCSMIRDANFDLWYDLLNQEDRFRYDAQVHCWMVLIGYGARLENGEECIDLCDGFDVTRLRNHRNFYYGAIKSDKSGDGWEICFFDKQTNCEAARF